MVAVADGAPEGDGGGVGDKDFDGQSFRLWPDLGAKKVYRFFVQTLPTS